MRPTLALLVSSWALACVDPAPLPTPLHLDAAVDVAPRDAQPDAAFDAKPDAPAVDAATRLRVLFVGNSYTYVNDLPGLVASVSRATRGPLIDVTSVTVGGATLRNHWETGDAPARLMEPGVDAVVLQGQSVEPALHYDEFRTYGVRFATLAGAYGVRAVYYATWPRRAGDALYAESWSGGAPSAFNERLDLGYTRVAATAGGTVAHVGNAWMAALRDHPSIGLYADDGSHPSPAGTWLAACVLYRALTGVAPGASADDAAVALPVADARALRETAAGDGFVTTHERP
jgi:hypothetical protein